MKKRVHFNPSKTILVCHGKCEFSIAEFIKHSLRLPLILEAREKGAKSIQINSLMQFLNGKNFKERSFFERHFKVDLEEVHPLRIFPIMDLDDIGDVNKIMNYKSGSMFKNHWLSDYIKPIYNETNLEEALKDMGYPDVSKSSKYYAKELFDDREKKNIDIIKEFCDKCEKCLKTNMNELIKHCQDIYFKW